MAAKTSKGFLNFMLACSLHKHAINLRLSSEQANMKLREAFTSRVPFGMKLTLFWQPS